MREARKRKGFPGNGKPWMLVMCLDSTGDLTEELLGRLGYDDPTALRSVSSVSELKDLRK